MIAVPCPLRCCGSCVVLLLVLSGPAWPRLAQALSKYCPVCLSCSSGLSAYVFVWLEMQQWCSISSSDFFVTHIYPFCFAHVTQESGTMVFKKCRYQTAGTYRNIGIQGVDAKKHMLKKEVPWPNLHFSISPSKFLGSRSMYSWCLYVWLQSWTRPSCRKMTRAF